MLKLLYNTINNYFTEFTDIIIYSIKINNLCIELLLFNHSNINQIHPIQ